MDYPLILSISGGALWLAGVVLLVVARYTDRKNYTIQKATPMPLSLVNERDDVWLRGQAICDHPLTAPHFGLPCLHFSYRIEERVQRTTRDSQGNTRIEYSWHTREQRRESAWFRLQDGEKSIAIDGSQADFKDLAQQTDHVGNFRHTLCYLPYPVWLSAVGSVSERRERLEPFANIPLLITPKERQAFFKSTERGEKLMRFFGFLLLFLGGATGFYGLFDHLSWPVATGRAFNPRTLFAAVSPATGIFLFVWAVYVYNTFVMYRLRVKNAWRNIDVDLKMRHSLIPQLLETARGYLAHERALFERVAELRNRIGPAGSEEQIGAEGELARAAGQLVARLERYPELKAQPVVARLTRELRALEEKIAHGRSFYNDTAKEYNDNVMTFPRGLLARAFGFKVHSYFAVEDDSASRLGS